MNKRVRKRRSGMSFTRVEWMEDRTLLSTFTVSNTADSGEGSLRQAILDANSLVGADVIEFQIASTSTVIQPLTALPDITDPLTIDGTTQPGFSGSPVVVLNGDMLPEDSFIDGLVINASDSLIKGLVVNGFDEGTGVVLGGFGSSGVTRNRIEGSIIGLNAAGNAAVPNFEGIRIARGATNNVVGGGGSAGNVVSGNLSYGILIGDEGTTGNRVLGNAIGTTSDRTGPAGNGIGIGITNGTASNEIGGLGVGEGNLISGNVDIGVLINGAKTSGNSLLGNRIGTNASGTERLGNFTTTAGIEIQTGAHDNVIGGTTVAARNLIAGNSGHGVLIEDSATHGNHVQGNFIGLNSSGSSAIANGGDGVFIVNSPRNTIGGDVAEAGNVIAASGRNGITIFGASAAENVVWANLIGTDVTGKIAVPNVADGVRIDDAPSNSIGGATPVRSNLISGNAGAGISISNPSAVQNVVQGNLIGIAIDALTSLSNEGDGVAVSGGASRNLIGGDAAPAWNFIAYNGANGIEVIGTMSLQNTVHGNRIYGNEGLAIDLIGEGITPNDTLDADNGPNGLQNFPVISAADAGVTLLFLQGTFKSAASSISTLEFYVSNTADLEGRGQGATPLGKLLVTTDAAGNATFSTVLSVDVEPGQVVTAIATDADGNSSEFSAPRQIGTNVPTNPVLTMPGPSITYRLQNQAVILDPTATLIDADSPNFNGGKLVVSFNSKNKKGERGEAIGIKNVGIGSGQIGLSGSDVTYGGVIVGKANGGNGGAGKAQGGNGGAGKALGGNGGAGKTPLIVTFNESATSDVVAALIRNITYSHLGKKTKLLNRNITFQVTDEAGHTSNPVNKLVVFTPATGIK